MRQFVGDGKTTNVVFSFQKEGNMIEHKFKKKFGQNFIKDESVVNKIIKLYLE